jgi:hypothetical protein
VPALSCVPCVGRNRAQHDRTKLSLGHVDILLLAVVRRRYASVRRVLTITGRRPWPSSIFYILLKTNVYNPKPG